MKKLMSKKVNIVYDFDGTLTKIAVPRYLILEKCGYKDGTTNKDFLQEFLKVKKEKNLSSEKAFYEAFFDILKRQNKSS